MGSLQKDITPPCPSNYGAGGDGQPCPSNISIWSGPEDLDKAFIEPEYLNELRHAINDEEARREMTQTDFGDDILDENGVTLAERWIAIKNSIDNIGTFNWSSETPEPGALVSDPFVEEVRENINTCEAECICNCNYCTCNCNYCTCDCNYCTCNCNYCTCDCNYSCTCNCNYACTCNCNYSCTCNCNYCTCDCNYCTCNCNYACTCNCNYSDKRLKKDIMYI